MTPLLFVLIVFAVSLVAGVIGSLLGLGGGIIVVPVLTLVLGVDIKLAIGASLVSVIATSSGAAVAYVREKLTNLRVAMFLEIGTTAGAMTGAFVAALIGGRWLFVLFGTLLAYSAVMMLRPRPVHLAEVHDRRRLAKALRMDGSYFDAALGKQVEYEVHRPLLGLIAMYGAGIVSGLLGVGSGVLKVPAMDLGMRLPIKVSTGTSNFMIGVTGAASAGVYFSRGGIDPFIAGPVAAGVLVGAVTGSKMLGRIENQTIRRMFVAALLIVSVQMLVKGLRG